jgi:hypothetical protein
VKRKIEGHKEKWSILLLFFGVNADDRTESKIRVKEKQEMRMKAENISKFTQKTGKKGKQDWFSEKTGTQRKSNVIFP